jgi:hypothetical protein
MGGFGAWTIVFFLGYDNPVPCSMMMNPHFKGVNEEDPDLFRDKRGHFHALFHFTRGHAFSEDGITWHWGGLANKSWESTLSGVECDQKACYNKPAHLQVIADAERPRVWVNATTGNPQLIFVASGGNNQPVSVGAGAKGFTIVQKIKTG